MTVLDGRLHAGDRSGWNIRLFGLPRESCKFLRIQDSGRANIQMVLPCFGERRIQHGLTLCDPAERSSDEP